jgi:hypothetical protein
VAIFPPSKNNPNFNVQIDFDIHSCSKCLYSCRKMDMGWSNANGVRKFKPESMLGLSPTI